MLKEVGGLTGSVQTGVAKVVGEGAKDFLDTDGETDMIIKHLEEIDLTKDDGEDDEPVTLSEEDHEAENALMVIEGGVELEVVNGDGDDTARQPCEDSAESGQAQGAGEAVSARKWSVGVCCDRGGQPAALRTHRGGAGRWAARRGLRISQQPLSRGAPGAPAAALSWGPAGPPPPETRR